jgi:hypothetical protein
MGCLHPVGRHHWRFRYALERLGGDALGYRTGLTARAAAMGGAYMFSKDAAANLRQKDDSYNSAIGGAFAGSMLGLKCLWHSNAYFARLQVEY